MVNWSCCHWRNWLTMIMMKFSLCFRSCYGSSFFVTDRWCVLKGKSNHLWVWFELFSLVPGMLVEKWRFSNMPWVVYFIALIGFIRSCTSSDQLPPIIVVFFVLLIIKIFTGSFLAGLLYWGFVIVTAFVLGIVGQIIGVITLEGDALNVQTYGLLILSMIIVGWYGLKLMLTGKIGK